MIELQIERLAEEWAELYGPMQHHPRNNRRFFMIDNWYAMAELVQGLEVQRSPSVVVESDMEGRIDDKFDRQRYTVYVIAQAREQGDARSSLKAKRIAKAGIMKFVNLLRAFQEHDRILSEMPFRKGGYLDQLRNVVQQGGNVMQAIDLDLSYDTTGEIFDGWYGVYVTFEDCVPLNRCIDLSDYQPKDYTDEE